MIKVEGFRAFHGTMRISPKNGIKPFEIAADWLYKPEYKCWYGQGRSFPEEICEVVRDDADIVRCGECKFNDDCEHQVAFAKYDYEAGTVTYEYHKVESCSYGKAKEGDDGK